MYNPAHDSDVTPDANPAYQNPTDNYGGADYVCRNHDRCYYKCRVNQPCDEAARRSCMRDCDGVFNDQMIPPQGGPSDVLNGDILALMIQANSVYPSAGPNGGPDGTTQCNPPPGRK
jgi:hypothetical protein